MKALINLMLTLLICRVVGADVIVESPSVEPVFNKSDVVCFCRVEGIRVVNEYLVPAPPGPPMTARQLEADVQVEDVFKSTNPSERSLKIEYELDLPLTSASQHRLEQGQAALMFLSKMPSGKFGFTSSSLGVVPFATSPEQAVGGGLEGLQSALAVLTVSPERSDRLSALRMLLGFPTIFSGTMHAISPLVSSDDRLTAALALAIFLKTKRAESVEELGRYLEANKQNSELPEVGILATELAGIRDPRALASVEALTRSTQTEIRYGAIQALRGMKEPKSIPTIVQELDDPDSTNRYLAVISLAEILSKNDGDYAPSMYLFDKNPQYYTDLWKAWWKREGNDLYGH